MTPLLARLLFCLIPVGWYVIRVPHARRSRRTPVARSARDRRETALLLVSLTGLGIVPLAYAVMGFGGFGERTFVPWLAWLGCATGALALVCFRLTHKALGRNWSVSLELREGHRLVQDGIYRHLRHPMYSAFWLWALAQALLLPNWIAGLAGLLGFGTLYGFRIGREERLMREQFGDDYQAYAGRTARLIPWLF